VYVLVVALEFCTADAQSYGAPKLGSTPQIWSAVHHPSGAPQVCEKLAPC
jgi:hypothetical protein